MEAAEAVSGIARIRELQPATGAELENLERTAWDAVDKDLLQLCRDRAVAMHRGDDGNYPENPDERERAYIDFTEQFVTSVSSVSEQQIDDLIRHSSPDEVFAFVYALYVVEMSARVDFVAEGVLR
jgi:hypothetical protein